MNTSPSSTHTRPNVTKLRRILYHYDFHFIFVACAHALLYKINQWLGCDQAVMMIICAPMLVHSFLCAKETKDSFRNERDRERERKQLGRLHTTVAHTTPHTVVHFDSFVSVSEIEMYCHGALRLNEQSILVLCEPVQCAHCCDGSVHLCVFTVARIHKRNVPIYTLILCPRPWFPSLLSPSRRLITNN